MIYNKLVIAKGKEYLVIFLQNSMSKSNLGLVIFFSKA